MLTFPIYLLAEWLCFIAAILLIRPSDKYWATVRFYLAFVVLHESIDYYLVWIVRIHSNHLPANLCILAEYGYGIWFLSKLIDVKKIGSICLIAYLIFLGSYIMAFAVSENGIFTFFDKADTVGSEIMIVLCMIYYYTLFNKEEYVDLLKEPVFWFISGCFVFYTTSICMDTFFQKLISIRIAHKISLRYMIMNILNIILYGCWIKSFICLKSNRSYLQRS